MTSKLSESINLQQIKVANNEQLKGIVQQIRERIKSICVKNGGHLAGNLGAVELTLALHYVFDSPKDQLVFDVGHQAYTHKLLTGRYEAMSTLRKQNGLGGFTNPLESVHDANISGHAGNAISIALGLSLADPQNCKIAIVGDGSLLNGMSVEAINHLASTEQNVLLIINDNDFSIDKCVGAIAQKQKYRQFIESFGLPIEGPLDGHDLNQLIATLQRQKSIKTPRALWVKTKKGKGDAMCETNPAQTHFFQEKKLSTKCDLKLQEVIGAELIKLAREDEHLMVITPAMSLGGGLADFARKFPERFFDVGIAESHALALGAGLASKGKKPICHFYASFLQRAYDQIIHDVALPKLPLVLLIDRTGLIGEDGATHQGNLTFSFLNLIPNFKILVPGSWQEIQACLHLATKENQPVAILYPKVMISQQQDLNGKKYALKEYQKLRSGTNNKLLVLTTGFMREQVEAVTSNLNFTHIQATQLKPWPDNLTRELSAFEKILVVEENSLIGGLGQLTQIKLSSQKSEIEILAVPDCFINQAQRKEQLEIIGLTTKQITKKIEKLLI